MAVHEARAFASVPIATLRDLRAATRALLAVMEPASDEEADDWLETNVGWRQRDEAKEAYRAAEGRARRLANWQDDALAAGAGEGGDGRE